MAKSKYEYVKSFEIEDPLLQACWIVVRLDGRGFHKFSDEHKFEKPNDIQALHLMNKCAFQVCKEFGECVVFAYGESDEYSFVLKPDTTLFNRRSSKIATTFSSLFSSSYVFYWNEFFPEKKLLYPPCFDGRCVLYPSVQILRDYLSWRQVDCHINNLYNTCFWTLVLKGGKTQTEAEAVLKGTLSDQKNELLFNTFGINYNNLPQIFRKGSIICKLDVEETVKDSRTNENVTRKKKRLLIVHEDIISDKFWNSNPHILGQQ